MAPGTPRTDVYACVVLEARWVGAARPSSAGWSRGPLPLPAPAGPRRAPGGAAAVADRATRAEFFSARLHDLLYGHPPDEAAGRWHREVETTPGPGSAVAEAAELLITGDRTLAVAHVRLAADPLAALAALTAPVGPGRDWLAALAGPQVELTPARARAVSHLVWEGHPPQPPPQLPQDVVRNAGVTSGPDWWAWFLAAGVTPAEFIPDPHGSDWSDAEVALSRDWSAVALRNGVCYVGRTARSASAADFHATARIYVRTLHLDVFLLLLVQRAALHRVSDAVAALDLDTLRADAVQGLEKDLLRIRTRLWSGDAARQGGQTSAVLVALQRQHRLPQLYERLVQDLTDLARYWAARTAATEEARQRAEEQRARRFSNAVSVVSFFLLPLTVVYTGAAVVADPSWELFLWSTVIGLPPCLVALGYSLRH